MPVFSLQRHRLANKNGLARMIFSANTTTSLAYFVMHIPGSWILLIFIAVFAAVILLFLHLTKLGLVIHQKIPDRPHRRLFLASVSFFITFLAVRLLVASITHHVGPFGYVEMGGRHIHHLVWGILLLLISGYATLAEVGTGSSTTFHLYEPLARAELWDWRSADTRRICPLVESGRGSLLVD